MAIIKTIFITILFFLSACSSIFNNKSFMDENLGEGNETENAMIEIKAETTNDFGQVKVNNFSSALLFTLENTGLSTATLNLVLTEADIGSVFEFSGGTFPGINGTCTSSLAAGSTCKVELKFKPNSEDSFTKDFKIFYNNGKIDTSSVLEIKGQGVTPKLYIGGSFKGYGGVYNRIIRLNTDASVDTNFEIGNGFDGIVNTAALQSDGKIIVGGQFLNYNGVSKKYLARINTDGTLDTNFITGAGPSSLVRAIAIQSDGKILIGGQFVSHNGTPRKYIARINSDGTLDTSFNPGAGASSFVTSIVPLSSGKILIGGQFITYNGTASRYLARLNSDGNLDGTFTTGAGPSNFVNDIVVQSDDKIIIVGNFVSYNAVMSSRIARLQANGVLDASFNVGAGFNAEVSSIAMQGNGKVVVGGDFTTYKTISHKRLLRINTDGSIDGTFNFGLNIYYKVETISLQADGKIIIGGQFSSYQGVGKNRITRLNTDGSVDDTFDLGSGFNETVYKIILQNDNKILVFGYFNSYKALGREHITRLESEGAYDEAFNFGFGTSGNIFSTTIQMDGKLIIGGSFAWYNGVESNNFARVNVDGTFDETFDVGSGTDNQATPITLLNNGKIIVGGFYTDYSGFSRGYIARVNSDGSLDESFDSEVGLDAPPLAIVEQSDGKLLVGGYFILYNSVAVNFLVRINTNGSNDESFNQGLGADGPISSIRIQEDGKIIIVGYFNNYDGAPRNYIARLNADGSLDTSFNVGLGASGVILSSVLQSDGKIIIAGVFNTYNGVAKHLIARVNSDGSLDETFNSGLVTGSIISTLAIQLDDKILIGGTFSTYDGITRNNIARLNSDGTLDRTIFEGVHNGFYTTVNTISIAY